VKYVRSKYTLWETESFETIITGYEVTHGNISLIPNGLLTIHKGYSWDGATGAIDTRDFVVPSLIHDALCELINLELLPVYEQARADEQMRITQESQGMPWYRRMITYMVVRVYQINKRSKPKRKILEIPT